MKLGDRINNVQVVRTSKHVIIHSSQLEGVSLFELAYRAGRICDDVAHVLVTRFGMRLGAGSPMHKPIVHFYDPLYEALARRGATYVEGVGAIDTSPSDGMGHVEYPLHIAEEVITAPLHLRRIGRSIGQIKKELTVLSQGQATNNQQTKVLVDSVILLTATIRPLTEVISHFYTENRVKNRLD